jgi:hypothetical protein
MGGKRQHASHGMAFTLAILQPLAQQQQASTFGHHRHASGGRLAQVLEAALG